VAHPKNQEDLSMYTLDYRLLKESRESWDHIASDKIIYLLDAFDVALDSFMGIAKDYVEGHVWLEVHLSISGNLGKGNAHYIAILEFCDPHDAFRKFEYNVATMSRNPSVLVNVAEHIEAPQKVALNQSGIPTVIRLKRFDDFHCFCGHSARLLSEPRGVLSPKNRKLRFDRIECGKSSQTPNKLVERCTQTIEYVTQDEGNAVGSVFDLTPNSIAMIFTIFLGRELIRLRFVENTQFLPKSIKVFLRPECLQIGVSQSDSHNG